MTAEELKGRGPKKYTRNCRHLQVFKKGHAGVRKTGSPDRIFRKNYEA
jgi:hypothetical protein